MDVLASPPPWPLVGRAEELARVPDALGGNDVRGVIAARRGRRGKVTVGRRGGRAGQRNGNGGGARARDPNRHHRPAVGVCEPAWPPGPAGLFEATARQLISRAGGRPLVLQVDDTHLLDPARRQWRFTSSLTARLIATARSGEPCPDTMTALRKDEDTIRLDLSRLSDAHTKELLERGLGGPVARGAVRWGSSSASATPVPARTGSGCGRFRRLSRNSEWWELVHDPPLVPRLREPAGARIAGATSAERELLELVALAEPLHVWVAERLVEGGGEGYAPAGRRRREWGLEGDRAGERGSQRPLAACCGARTPLLAGAFGDLGLTPREQKTAPAAARGLSNRLIAERLVRSSRTVESHLFNAMTKLEVRSRNELAQLGAEALRSE